MTAAWRSASPEEPIKAWVRAHPELDSRRNHIVVMDSDMWVHRYASRRKGLNSRDVQYLMLVEIKTHGADLAASQHDTLHIVNQVLRTEKWKTDRVNGQFAPGHTQNTAHVTAFSSWLKREVQVISYGAHLLQLSGAAPDTSDWIKWDRKEITERQLVELLALDRHPDSLLPMEHRRHKRILSLPTLFDLMPEDLHDVMPDRGEVS